MSSFKSTADGSPDQKAKQHMTSRLAGTEVLCANVGCLLEDPETKFGGSATESENTRYSAPEQYG